MSLHPDEVLALRSAPGGQCLISLHGAQLLSWRTADGNDHLYLSPTAALAAGRCVRGGTPICFPQFGQRGTLAKHGFVRNQCWRVTQAPTQADGMVQARLELASVDAPGLWQHPFQLALTVRLGPAWLELELEARNPGPAPYRFTGALHTYFAVTDVRGVRLEGLRGHWYEDALDGDAPKADEEPGVRFEGELDRVYLATPATLRLVRPGLGDLRISQAGFPDTVVWNPGPVKAASLGDMPAADWLKMVCVEAAVVKAPVVVAPGGVWRGMQRLELG